MKKIFFLLLIIIFNISNIYGQCYDHRFYVDSDNGDDELNSGKKDCNGNIHPWKTISKVNDPGFNYYANDTISFRCGQRFIGTLLPQGSNLIFNSYSSGDNPIIDRNTWSGTDGVDNAVYSLNISSTKNYLTFNNLKFINGWQGNIYILGAHDITFESCIIDSAHHNAYSSGAPGNIFVGCAGTTASFNITIRNCTIQNAKFGHGGYFEAVQRLLLEYTTVQNNGVNGIQILSYTQGATYACYYDTVRYCVFKNNDLSNQWDYTFFDNGMRNSAVYCNIFEANTSGSNNGALVRINNNYNIPPRQVGWYNNTFILHTAGEAFDWGPSNVSDIDSIWVKNNIIYLDDGAQTGMWFYSQAGSHNVITNNLYHYPLGGENLFYLGLPDEGTPYPSIQTWNSATYNFTTPNGGYEIASDTEGTNSTFHSDFTNLQLKDGSRAILTGIDVGLTKDITGKAVADPPDIGAYQNSTYWYGSQSNNQTMSGNAAIIGDLTLTGGGTFTISPGTHIRVKDAYNINFNGKLSCQGSQQNKIIFDPLVANNNWGTITLNGSAADGSNIKYTNINYCNEIDVINTSNDTIQYCNIDSSSMHGIYFSGGTGSLVLNDTIKNSNTAHGIEVTNSANVTCTGNVVKKMNLNNRGVGIFFGGGGTGVASKNDVRGFDWGIAAIWGASPSSNKGTESWNNRVTNCNTGIMVYNDSYPVFGSNSAGDIYSDNSFYNNGLNVSVSNNYPPYNSGLSGRHNWWGSNPPNLSLFFYNAPQYFYYDGYLTSDPWPGTPLPKSVGGGTNPVVAANSIDSLLTGITLMSQSRFGDAKDFFVSYLRLHPENQAAYTYLYGCANNSTTPQIIDFFNSLPSEILNVQKLKLSYLYLRQGNIDVAKRINESIVIDNPNTSLAVRAILNNFYIALYNEDDVKTATDLLNEVKIQASLSTPMEISTAEDALTVRTTVISTKLKSILSKPLTRIEKPTSYSISQNYPNPFNPSTTIRYQIPKTGLVSLKVYDIIGREVATLINENKSEGSYEISFNASKFPSGVYIYQLRVNDFVSSKKMILLK